MFNAYFSPPFPSLESQTNKDHTHFPASDSSRYARVGSSSNPERMFSR